MGAAMGPYPGPGLSQPPGPPPPPPQRVSNPNYAGPGASVLPPAQTNMNGSGPGALPPFGRGASPRPEVRPILDNRMPSPKSGYPHQQQQQYPHHPDISNPGGIEGGAPAPASALAAAEAAAAERNGDRPGSVGPKRMREWEEDTSMKKPASDENRARLDDMHIAVLLPLLVKASAVALLRLAVPKIRDAWTINVVRISDVLRINAVSRNSVEPTRTITRLKPRTTLRLTHCPRIICHQCSRVLHPFILRCTSSLHHRLHLRPRTTRAKRESSVKENNEIGNSESESSGKENGLRFRRLRHHQLVSQNVPHAKWTLMRTMMMRLMRTRRVVLRRLQHRDLVRLLEKLRRHHQRVRMAMSMALQTANQRWKSRLTIRFFLLLVMTVDDSVEVLYCSSNKL